jgi:hypothetical protein
VPVVKFPGVKKTLDELTPEELEEAFNRVVATLPHISDEEAARMDEKWWDETYYEHLEEMVGNFSFMLHEWMRATGDTYGTESKEYRDLQQEVEPVRTMLHKLEYNCDNPEVKKVVKPLSAIWAEYRGWERKIDGGYAQRKKPLGPEVISAFWRTASLDI